MKIVADINIPFLQGVFEPFAQITYLPGSEINNANVANADALIIRTRTICNRNLLQGSKVKLIATATIGSDHIDADYCLRNGIDIASAAGCNSRGVLQWVAAALARLSVQQKWNPEDKTIGVVGMGNVGSLVARYARLWGFTVLCSDPPLQQAGMAKDVNGNDFIDFNTICRMADIITFHVPLTTTKTSPHPTAYMASAQFFTTIHKGAIVLNSSRGEIIDNNMLTRSVVDNQIVCAIDTWEAEPDINLSLLNAAAIATPHIAGYNLQGKANGTSAAVRAVAEKFGMHLLKDWYPSAGVEPVAPYDISWNEMCDNIVGHFDITRQTELLKNHPEDFETFRNNYNYRTEFF